MWGEWGSEDFLLKVKEWLKAGALPVKECKKMKCENSLIEAMVYLHSFLEQQKESKMNGTRSLLFELPVVKCHPFQTSLEYLHRSNSPAGWYRMIGQTENLFAYLPNKRYSTNT